MPVIGGLPAAVIQSRKRLDEGRQKLRAQHDSGSPGLHVCVRLTDLVDSIVLDLFDLALEQSGMANSSGAFSLVAHGGYGRRDVAPFSDVDLMLLHSKSVATEAVSVARLLSQWIVDSGCQLGFSLRTPQQSWKLAWSDATVFSSLAESRLMAGSTELFATYIRGLRQGARRRSQKLIRKVEHARFEERRKYGETVFLLEPNIKRSRGGLRDIQLMRWIGFAKFGECDIERLAQLGHITPEDHQALRRGYQYLLRLRNQMHFTAGKSQDQLDRALQIRLAEWSGFEGEEGILPVEQFMKQYFEHTSEIRYSSAHFANSAKWQSPIAKSIEHTVAFPVRRDYRVGWRHVWATKSGLERLKRDPAAVLELMSVSSLFDKPIEHTTWREIRAAMLTRQAGDIDDVTIQRFMELLSSSGNLADQLRRLHELRVLEQIIPGMTHARCLLQFNQYHKYTVDAHSIQAVDCVTDLESDESLLGIMYRGLKNKAILHLALLIHDLGKGFAEDHSEVGRRIAAKTADRLCLSAQDKETLEFLVHQHLLLAHTAFRYDLSDNRAAVKFASVVGSSERLQLLLLLTYADLASVGPDVVNQWKVDLLLQLYYQTDSHFRDDKPGEGFRGEITSRREAILHAVPANINPGKDWWKGQIDALPIGYLMRTPPHLAVSELANLLELEHKPSLTWGRYIESQQAVEYTIATRQTGRPIGAFHRITGVISSLGMQINAADIHTQPGDIAWDRFLVEDQEYEGAPPQSRIDLVCQKINQSLNPESPAVPNFPMKWSSRGSKNSESLEIQPTQVRFDNSTSESHTIITLFAYDRLGLLYSVSKALFEMELILQFAKISTHLDQVVDVFYVTDMNHAKIEESTHLYMIRQRLLQAARSPLKSLKGS
ncbi:bifunctional uridylyltransferase/uridylyl-removing protein GlnD [Aureliella helgolandensis]|uniref:Bifunctional uridylyltransferase/uridylyl-removing enzyme n=1 Tax=Aureliella helgolandensis TaxID=2527968 RepID=A0A518GGZ8_9BACT|nr:[protein-PII] uridylyltransferase [Aureliella helgolandensis]QDV27838.1 Bifunctional uridylyltransferase/uridylyl-removing enzyme [Aureliella helgolandensis]